MLETKIYYVSKDKFLELFGNDMSLVRMENVPLDRVFLRDEIPFWRNNKGKMIFLPYSHENGKKYSPERTEMFHRKSLSGYRNKLVTFSKGDEETIRDVASYFIHVDYKNVNATVSERYLASINK